MLFLLGILFLLEALNAEKICDDSPGCPNSASSGFGTYTKAAVSSHSVYCSEIGRNTLLKGGNAVEAAIATLFCIGVMDAEHAGLGGGHFMTIYNATTRKCSVIDAREVASAAANETMFVGREQLSENGWLSIAIPGELHGYWTAYKRYGGKTKWKSLIQPTIDLMEEGHPTSYLLANTLKAQEDKIGSEPTLKMFINPKTDKPYREGEQIVTRQALKDTLKSLALSTDPVKLFYNGSMTVAMVQELQKNGGILTLEDFSSYRSIVHENEDVIYTKLKNGRFICGPPPPSGSAVTQSILKVLDSYGTVEPKSATDWISVLHRYIEASKFAYAARSRLGDPRFNPDAYSIAREITSDEYAQRIRSLITDEALADAEYGGNYEIVDDHGTSHVSVIDPDGNAVSVTSTINLLMGAGVASESTGILWNDQMDDFSTPGLSNAFGITPSKSNFIRPGKRPMSSTSPLIIFNISDPMEVMAIGGTGGSRIISGVSYVAFRSLWLNQDIKEATDAPRLHNQLYPSTTFHENDFSIEYTMELEKRGHKMIPWWSHLSKAWHPKSAVTTVKRTSLGAVFACSEYRCGAQSAPAGF